MNGQEQQCDTHSYVVLQKKKTNEIKCIMKLSPA